MSSSPTVFQKPLALQYPWHSAVMIPLLAASAILFGFGLFAPLITIEKLFFFKNTVSVYTGIIQLKDDGDYFLFSVLLGFSVIFPTIKLGMLFWLWLSPWATPLQIRNGHTIFEALGKWSMLDVFVAALMVMVIRLGSLMQVTVHEGIYLFGTSVILSMLAASVLKNVVTDLK